MKDKRIPTILGTFLLLTILFSGVWLSLQKTNLFSQASGDCSPIGIQVTNLTNKSVDISFQTASACSSNLVINTLTLPNFGAKSTIHYFRIDNLSSSTQYQYHLLIDGQEFKQTFYTFKTAPLPSGTLPTANLAWGKILLSTGLPSVNSLVYLNIPGAWPLSALTDSNGQWHISLSNSYTDNKLSLFTPPLIGTEDIIIYSPNGQLTQVENSLTKNDPVPNIIVGQGFVSSLGTGPASTVAPTKISTIVPTIALNTKLSINYPSEGETITTLRPDIFGQGKNYSTVSLKIDTVISGNATTKADGSWNWSPVADLKIGNHILVATLGGETVTRNFIIGSVTSNSSPLSFSASSSAVVVTPTTIPTIIPTIRTGKVSTKSGIPVTGNASPLYLLLLSSLFTVSFSLYFFYRDEK
ncbi:MAG: hypothetical protein WC069_03755 [Candidatus Shapirobacteria bacterium]